MFDSIRYLQYVIHLLSILANGFALYCLWKQGHRHNLTHTGVSRMLLLKNLASGELVKMIYDFVPLISYHYFTPWYEKNHMYFEIVELILMTIFFEAFLLILADKMCIVNNDDLKCTSKLRYDKRVRKGIHIHPSLI